MSATGCRPISRQCLQHLKFVELYQPYLCIVHQKDGLCHLLSLVPCDRSCATALFVSLNVSDSGQLQREGRLLELGRLVIFHNQKLLHHEYWVILQCQTAGSAELVRLTQYLMQTWPSGCLGELLRNWQMRIPGTQTCTPDSVELCSTNLSDSEHGDLSSEGQGGFHISTVVPFCPWPCTVLRGRSKRYFWLLRILKNQKKIAPDICHPPAPCA